MTTILTNVADIFSHGNRHMKNKFKYLSPKSQEVIKYIINKLRKYRGEFWESNKTISLNVGCCIRTVQSSIRKAQKLGILQVSERYEKVITSDKMRRTTNIIRLLPFKEFSIVKEITEKVMEVATVIVEKVSNRKSAKPRRNTKNRQVIRTEIVPDWLNKPHEPEVLSDEDERLFVMQRDKLQRTLKEKYGKKK